MQRSVRSGLCILAFVVSASFPALAENVGPAADVKAIRTLEEGYIAAFSNKNVLGVMASFVRGQSLLVFDLVPPREYRGWDAYKKDWEDFFAAFSGPLQASMTDLSITTDGKLGFGHRIDHLTLTDKNGTQVRLVVRVTHGYRKIDDKWLIVHEHVSVPVDPATWKAVLMSQP